jgi:RND family efflux transporter MFP subunit
MMPPRLIVACAVAGIVVVALAQPLVGSSKASPASEPLIATAAPSAPVPTVAPVPAPAPEPASSSADGIRVLLIPALETTLSSPVAGRMRVLDSSLGSSFAAGSTLVGFDCDEPTARLNMAKAELSGAQETHEAKIRLQGLEQASQVEVAMAASAAAKAQAAVELANAQVAQCSVHAPWAGRVAKIHVRNYMSVSAGQPLLDLVKTGPLKLKLSVPSKWLRDVRPGVPFAVSIDETGKSYDARVSAINSRIDPVSQTIEIEADMAENYPELLGGMSGTAQFQTAAR